MPGARLQAIRLPARHTHVHGGYRSGWQDAENRGYYEHENICAHPPRYVQEEVLRILGPSESSGTAYFKSRDELVWERRYCDEWNEASRFEVLFDGSKEVMRSTMSLADYQRGLCGSEGGCICAHARLFLITTSQDSSAPIF